MELRRRMAAAGSAIEQPNQREFNKAYIVAIIAKFYLDRIIDITNILQSDDNGQSGVRPADLFSPEQIKETADNRGVPLDKLQIDEIHNELGNTGFTSLEEIHRIYLVRANIATIDWHDRIKDSHRLAREISFLIGLDTYLGAKNNISNAILLHNVGAKDENGNDLNQRRGLEQMMKQIDTTTQHADPTLRIRIESHLRLADLSQNDLREELARGKGKTLVNLPAERPSGEKPA